MESLQNPENKEINFKGLACVLRVCQQKDDKLHRSDTNLPLNAMESALKRISNNKY